MWPILLCSITAFAIVLERLWVLGRAEDEAAHLLRQAGDAIRNHQFPLAEHLCNQNRNTPLSRMILSAVQNHGRSREEILQRMEEAASIDLPHLERRLPVLGTIAHMAPLLGLLGTVTGLVRCFQVIQEKTSTVHPVNPADLAGGIWEALLTTVFGLIVAIPAYGLHHYLLYRLNAFTHQLHAASLELADLLAGDKHRVA